MPADTTITATDVINEFGSYYINEGQNMQSLLTRPFFPFGTRDAFTNVPTDNTQLRFSDVQVGKILQPFQKTFTPKGSVVFTPVKIDLHPVKIDQQFQPQDLVYSWLGFLTSNNTDRSTWPFIRWFIEMYLLNQLWEDMELDLIYKGDAEAIVAGTAGEPAHICDGVKKIINDNIADMTQIVTGAPAADPKDFVTQVEEFVKDVPKRYWNVPMTLNMNPDLGVRFIEGMQQKYNMNYQQITDTMSVRNFSNIKVKGRQSMDESNKIWMTPVANAVFAVKGFSNATAFELEKVDRNVKIWTDFHVGIGFLQNDLVFTNDQDM
jgi:hypothetical protein